MKKASLSIIRTCLISITALSGINIQAGLGAPSLLQLCVNAYRDHYNQISGDIIAASPNSKITLLQKRLLEIPDLKDKTIIELLVGASSFKWNVVKLEKPSQQACPSDGVYPKHGIEMLTFGANNTLFADDDRYGISYAWNIDSHDFIGKFTFPSSTKSVLTTTKPSIEFSPYRITSTREHNGRNNIDTLTITNLLNKGVSSWTLPYDASRRIRQDAAATALELFQHKDNLSLYIGTNTGEVYMWQAPFSNTEPKKIKLGKTVRASHPDEIKEICMTPEKHMLSFSLNSIRRTNISPSSKSPVKIKSLKNASHTVISYPTQTIAAGGWRQDLTLLTTQLDDLQTVPLDYFMSTLKFSPDGRYLAVGTHKGSVYLLEAPITRVKSVTDFLAECITLRRLSEATPSTPLPIEYCRPLRNVRRDRDSDDDSSDEHDERAVKRGRLKVVPFPDLS